MVSKCPSLALAAGIAKPFAKPLQQTESSCKARGVVRVGFGGFWGGFCFFVALAVEELSEGLGGWQEEGNLSSQHQHWYKLQWDHILRQ